MCCYYALRGNGTSANVDHETSNKNKVESWFTIMKYVASYQTQSKSTVQFYCWAHASHLIRLNNVHRTIIFPGDYENYINWKEIFILSIVDSKLEFHSSIPFAIEKRR